MPGKFSVIPLERRFWPKVDKTGECWLWTGQFPAWFHGYGAIRIGLHKRRAHRVAWELTNGPIPDGLYVLHKCDVKACVRPDHLFLGTHADNMEDKVRKERHTRGEAVPLAKLTTDQVREMRQLSAQGSSLTALGARFNVHPTTVSGIVRRHDWKHVP